MYLRPSGVSGVRLSGPFKVNGERQILFMTPAFFLSNGERLFSVYHAPTVPPRSHGVLLCYPLGHEYMRSHWAFRQLASRLAAAGFDVLRFDYFGTGDSSGEPSQASPEMWIENIQDAGRELSRITRCPTLSIVGLRLGALLAAHAVKREMSCKTLVQWDPIVEGSQYLSGVRELTSQLYAQEPLSRHSSTEHQSEPMMGLQLSDPAARDLSLLRGVGGQMIKDTKIVTLFSSVRQQGQVSHGKVVEGGGEWQSLHKVGDAVLNAALLQEIQVVLSE